jgi:5,6-dimethylbenzimidazole synthase
MSLSNVPMKRKGDHHVELFDAIKGRRSCRAFSSEPVSEDEIVEVLEAANWAPSPLNAQPWRFLVITSADLKSRISQEAERCRKWALEQSGWKWLDRYPLDFLKTVPTMIAVVGDPRKSGVDQFMEDGPTGYQHACAAAIQNIHLAAHALGLGTLWFTLYDRKILREILSIGPDEVPLALVLMGRPAAPLAPVPRKNVKEKMIYLR